MHGTALLSEQDSIQSKAKKASVFPILRRSNRKISQNLAQYRNQKKSLPSSHEEGRKRIFTAA
ncbi:MAG TPA: hypothetical protein VEK05_02735, partial [Burkholderiales bacterium]|nr:hypothetical protein [Burkholderiales bacterium]